MRSLVISHPSRQTKDTLETPSRSLMSGHEARASLLGGSGPVDYSYQPFSGGYHEREGYPVKDMSKRRSLKETARPGWSAWSWAFMGIALIQAAIVLAFESYIFATFQLDLRGDAKTQTQARTIPTFLTLYIFGFVYQLVLIWDALRLKNTIQIIGLVMYNIGLLIYGSVQMSQIKSAVLYLSGRGDIDISIWYHTRPFLIAIPCIIAFGTCLLAVVAWKLYDEFAWTIYKHISADLRLKRRYLTFQVYIALLKFDFFFFLGFTVQFVVIVYRTNLEFALTLAAIPVTIIILFAAAWFTRKEWLIGEIAVIILYFGGLAYFIFKMFRMYSASHGDFYKPARKELTTFAVLTIILLLMTIVNACMCANNFEKGLKPYVTKRRPMSPDVEKPDYTTEMADGPIGKPGIAPPRREID